MDLGILTAEPHCLVARPDPTSYPVVTGTLAFELVDNEFILVMTFRTLYRLPPSHRLDNTSKDEDLAEQQQLEDHLKAAICHNLFPRHRFAVRWTETSQLETFVTHPLPDGSLKLMHVPYHPVAVTA